MKVVLRENWYTRDIAPEFDTKMAGIYEWRIDGVGIYVGKAKELHGRILNYPNNVRRMIEGLHWHGNPKKDYRPVHYALREAYDQNMVVTVAVLATCAPDKETRKRLEQDWIRRRRAEEKLGGPKVLNSN